MNRAVKLVGKKVVLCPVEKKDLKLLQKWVNDLEVTMFTTRAPFVFTFEDEVKWLKDLKKRKNDIHLTIVDKKKGNIIGITSLHNINSAYRTADFGIMIGDKRYWSKGYGTEATILMLDFAFNVLNLNNIMLGVYDFNKRAQRVYTKLGFKKIGERRKSKFFGRKYYDTIFMDILADEFKNSKIKEMVKKIRKG